MINLKPTPGLHNCDDRRESQEIDFIIAVLQNKTAQWTFF